MIKFSSVQANTFWHHPYSFLLYAAHFPFLSIPALSIAILSPSKRWGTFFTQSLQVNHSNTPRWYITHHKHDGMSSNELNTLLIHWFYIFIQHSFHCITYKECKLQFFFYCIKTPFQYVNDMKQCYITAKHKLWFLQPLVRRCQKHVRCSICNLTDKYQYNWIKLSVKSVVWKATHDVKKLKMWKIYREIYILVANILVYASLEWFLASFQHEENDKLIYSFPSSKRRASEIESSSANSFWASTHLCKDNRKYFLGAKWPHFGWKCQKRRILPVWDLAWRPWC